MKVMKENKFVNSTKLKKVLTTLVVSVSLAAATLETLIHGNTNMFNDARYVPNSYVYNKVLDAGINYKL